MADNTNDSEHINPAFEMGEIPPPPMSPGIPYPTEDTELPPSIDDIEIPPPPTEPPPPIPEEYVQGQDSPTPSDGVDDTPQSPAETPPSPPLDEPTSIEVNGEPPASDGRIEEIPQPSQEASPSPPPPEASSTDGPSPNLENQSPGVDEISPPPLSSSVDYQGEMDNPPPMNAEVPSVSEEVPPPPPPPSLLNGPAYPTEPDEIPIDTPHDEGGEELTAELQTPLEENSPVTSVDYADKIESDPQVLDLNDSSEMNSAINYANTLPSNQPTASANAHAESHDYADINVAEKQQDVKPTTSFKIEAVVWTIIFTLLSAVVAVLLYFMYSIFDAGNLPNEPLRVRITLTLSNEYLPGYAISTHRDFRMLEAKFITGVNDTFTSQNSGYATVYEGAEIFFFANGSIRTSFFVNLSRPLSTSMRKSALVDDVTTRLLPFGFSMGYFQDLLLVPNSITVPEVIGRSQGGWTGGRRSNG